MIPHVKRSPECGGFSAVELLAVVSVLAVLLALAMPLLAKMRLDNDSVVCMSQKGRLATAWLLYAQDNRDRVVSNFGIAETEQEITTKRYRTWANNVMSWAVGGIFGESATNRNWLATGPLAPYVKDDLSIYRCPSDTAASAVMRKASISQRLRSVSMNGFFGRFSTTADPTASGVSYPSSEYRQFLKLHEIQVPQNTWAFIDEHPDSINDGIFFGLPDMTTWLDLPAAYHLGGAGFAFVDSHVEIHRWESKATIYPLRYSYPPLLPLTVANKGLADRDWFNRHTGYVLRNTGQLKFP